MFLMSVWCQADEKIIIDAQSTEISKGISVLTGNVRFHSPGKFLLTADKAVYDNKQQTVELKGNVKVDFYSTAGLIEISSQHVIYHFMTSTGVFHQVEVRFGDDYHFTGERIERHEKDQFHFFSGILTTCNQAIPQWSMRVKEAVLVQEGYSRLKGTTFVLKKTPVFYFPYLILPTMRQRQSGLLIPDTGHSQRNGTYFKIPVYIAPRQDWDLTLTPGYYDISGGTLDAELRYHTKPDQKGHLSGFAMKDEVIESGDDLYEAGRRISPDRYRYSFSHQQKMKSGALVIQAEQGSDHQVEWDFVEDINSGRTREYFYDVWMGREWKNQYFSLNLREAEYIFADQSGLGVIKRLPSFHWMIPAQNVGMGFYLKSNVHVDLIDHNQIKADSEDGSLHYSLNAEIKRTSQIGPYIFMNYGISLLSSKMTEKHTQQGIDTTVLAGTIEFFGPKLYRSYRNKALKHFISYGVAARYNNFENPILDSSLEFDEVDSFLNEQIKGLDSSWVVRSSFFRTKLNRSMPFLEFEMRKKVNTETRKSPLEIAVRVPGFYGVHFNSLIKYRTDEKRFDLLSFYGSAKKGNWTGYAGYVKRQIDPTDQDSIILRSDLEFPRWKSGFHIALDYDFLNSEFKSQQMAYKLYGQCMGMQIAYHETPEAGTGETKKWYRISVQFRNLGEIGSMF